MNIRNKPILSPGPNPPVARTFFFFFSKLINLFALYTSLFRLNKQQCDMTTTTTLADDELAHAITVAESKAPEDLTEHDKMALLGRPKAGDVVRAQLRIKESKEFKVSTNYCVAVSSHSLLLFFFSF